MPEPFPQALESTPDQRGRPALQRAGERRRAAPPARRCRCGRWGSAYEIVLVDDGSRTRPPASSTRCGEDPHSSCVHLSRNFGHQAAVSAGIDHARGQAVVVMDGDLQDPPEVIPQFVEQMARGLRRRLRRSPASQGGPPEATGLLRLLSGLECDQRPGHPAGQRRLLPDGPARGRRAQAPARADAVRPRACGRSSGSARSDWPTSGRPARPGAQVHASAP